MTHDDRAADATLTLSGQALPDLRIVPRDAVHLHEDADPVRVERLSQRLRRDGVLRNPPAAAALPGGGFVVLDGANRTSALARLGIPVLPLQVVEYDDPGVQLDVWRHLIVEPLDIGGQTYGHLSGEGLAAGNALAINISSPSSAGGPGLYWLVPLVIVVAAAVFTPLYLVRRRRLRPVPAGGAADRRQQLLNEIAELDDSFEAGQINEEAYHARRDAMKAELRALMQSQEE